MKITYKFVFSVLLILASALYIFPWKSFGIDINSNILNKSYVLGLDLQGGVELDYQVDLSGIKTAVENDTTSNAAMGTTTQQTVANREATVVEGLKKIIDKRVNSLGLAEPNIQTLKYGNETHLVVQIPTESYSDLTPEEQEKRQKQDIENAKNVIGKVVNLDFREMRTETTEEEYAQRKILAENAHKDLQNLEFSVLSQKYNLPSDGIFVKTGTGTIPPEAEVSALKTTNIESFPYYFDVEEVVTSHTFEGMDPMTATGYVALKIEEKLEDNNYKYSYVLVDREPGIWMPAKTADGKILNDEYLNTATAFLDPVTAQPKISLVFNPEGAKIFGEISQRLIGKQLAIFVGGEMVMNANVNQAITTGQAEISGGYATLLDAQEVADNITTGIVPAPIYLTSERTIDAKIGATALSQIVTAGVIGLFAIVAFLVAFYRVGGLLAGVALTAYAIFLIAIVKLTGVVLTLAAIAGVILSIGLAIDANILIFERIREALKEKVPLSKAITMWFEQSWSAIWDSHITSFVSALVLYVVGVSLIKGFGFMLGVGILLSLFTAMWVSRVFIQFTAKYIKNPKVLFGYSAKK